MNWRTLMTPPNNRSNRQEQVKTHPPKISSLFKVSQLPFAVASLCKNHVAGERKALAILAPQPLSRCLPTAAGAPPLTTTRISNPQPKTSTFHLLVSIQSNPYPLRSRNLALHNRILQDVRSIELVAENEKGGACRAVRFGGLQRV